MRKLTLPLLAAMLCVAVACSPRDFLTRRLAADLIAGSEVFRTTQQFWLRTGIIPNKDYLSPEYLVLQRHSWITASLVSCPADVAPPPCQDVTFTPLGVETFRDLIPTSHAASQYFEVPIANRELLEITGISKNGNLADVDFSWRWVAVNEVGAALYSGGMKYNSSVGFKHYDDGWRLIEGSNPKTSLGIDDALKNAEPVR
jgi:hypothetical protein